MPRIYVYTKKGEPFYYSGHPDNYPGDPSRAKNCDVNDAMHMALCRDGGHFIPLRNNTGVLFPKAELPDGVPGGVTKTLVDPWVFRQADGGFAVIGVRRGQNKPDEKTVGSAMLFFSQDLVRFCEAGFIKLSDSEVRRPKCRYEDGGYVLEWESEGKLFRGKSPCLCHAEEISAAEESLFEKSPEGLVPDAEGGNVIEVTDEEADVIERFLGPVYNVGVDVADVTLSVGDRVSADKLSRVVCRYNDGSVHEKPVIWNEDDVARVDTSLPGEYLVSGKVYRHRYPFPFLKSHMSDPCICEYKGRYFLSSSGSRSVVFRVSDTIDGLAEAKPYPVYTIPEEDKLHANMWAQEMHVIKGVPYVLTTVGEREWSTVRAHILRCVGDPADPAAWEAPRLVMRPNGEELQPRGISLDMTYFCVNGVHYVMWSDRIIEKRPDGGLDIETADIKIAVIDPDAPWQLVTEPVTVLRPIYGWDRYETEVDEGPYLLRRGDDLFVTISGSSTGLADLYCLGLMHAKAGDNLLDPDAWDWLPYPVLTKESVPGEYGPGHNSFIKDPETGDDLLVYHAVPHREDGRTLGRHMGIRRVHWAASGYPYLEMTEEMDLSPELESVKLKITVK